MQNWLFHYENRLKRLALKRKQNVLFCFPLLSREKKRQKKRCWNPQKGLAFHTAKRSVSRSGDRSQKSPFTNGLSDDKSTLGSWLLRISLVWFSLVHIFKKIAQTAYVIFTIQVKEFLHSWLKCCGFGSCRFLPHLKNCTSQGPGASNILVVYFSGFLKPFCT